MSRAEKRARQREQSYLRAEKMHEARMAASAEMFPEEIASTPKIQAGTQYHIGCSGWFYWDWKGLFYPSELPTSRWFEHYREHFHTVELNAPFYSWPTLATVRGWRRQIGQSPFVYTVKASELITHVKQFQGTKTMVKDFGLIADLLGPHMGCFLFQLPPSLHFTTSRLKSILSQLDPTRRNVVEFRHASWWNDAVFTAFQKAGVIFCACSGPKLPDELVKTADDIYVRFHGVHKWYRHDYSQEELDDWATRIQRSGAKRVWIYFNNDFEGFAIKNARELRERLMYTHKQRR
jgi:uncharacterized protein YecE (DUF72 family)